MDQPKGIYDGYSGKIYPQSTSTWSGLSGTTWDSWKEWAYSRDTEIIWIVEPLYMGLSPTNVNLKITCESTGIVSYKVYTSDTGVFNGEEQETIIPNNATAIAPFRARYIQVMVYSEEVNGITPTISEITVKTELTRSSEILLNDLDTSTCAGSVTGRVLPMPVASGSIVDIKVTPHETTSPYNLDVYVTNTPTSTYLIPKIISKSIASPTIALVGVDNHPRDGIVDVVIKTMPPSYMSGNNLVTG